MSSPWQHVALPEAFEVIHFACRHLRAQLITGSAEDETYQSLQLLFNARTRFTSADSPIPLLMPLRPLGEPEEIHDRFMLSATPDHFITGCYAAGKLSSIEYRGPNAARCEDVIQYLEYQNASDEGLHLHLPRYVFQLGGLILPGNSLLMEQKLPFVAVLDVLNPDLPVWLVHDNDVEEDFEDEETWRPSLASLMELEPLFDDLKHSRQPTYHIAQLAPRLDDWANMSWDAMIHNIRNTRSRTRVKIKESENIFRDLVKTNREGNAHTSVPGNLRP
ncbi:hypothetical protein F5Y10DRAFT_263173 [Nemania abortiva]|nr:hypothetical protein F5Y10DRAFT_263173 [Nemania abortiva]